MSTERAVRDYPFGVFTRLDMDPLYRTLQHEEPVSRVRLRHGGEGWLVTRYTDVRQVLADQRFSRAATVGREDVARVRPQPSPPDAILSMDPPEHTRLRRLVAKAFTANRVQHLLPRLWKIVGEQLDEIEKSGPPADLVAAVALPLPVVVICEMLGVPPEDQHRFRDFSDSQMSTTAYTMDQIAAAHAELRNYLTELAARRRAHPTDDLMGALVAARDDDDRLSEAELVNLGIGLLVAGHDTTANQIANFTYLLLERPERWESLAAQPDSLPAAIEELLRYTQLSAGAIGPRVALEDVALGGVTIRAGDAVLVHPYVANRDETAFDDPDTLDLTRGHNAHLAFGHGAHHCLGAQLARLELRVAIGALLHRFPRLRLAIPADEVRWKSGLALRGPEALPVRW
ncbi:cytochrome P450 [Nocardia sp. BMG51109]|uniref:cytochrome P450 n=1 Tax=Nocardia sp. BMG51109 TaxID=1056816 RepID=UPI0004658EA2|nr:cytochrome P450 [Nocardia sp. BMG51109]